LRLSLTRPHRSLRPAASRLAFGSGSGSGSGSDSCHNAPAYGDVSDGLCPRCQPTIRKRALAANKQPSRSRKSAFIIAPPSQLPGLYAQLPCQGDTVGGSAGLGSVDPCLQGRKVAARPDNGAAPVAAIFGCLGFRGHATSAVQATQLVRQGQGSGYRFRLRQLSIDSGLRSIRTTSRTFMPWHATYQPRDVRPWRVA